MFRLYSDRQSKVVCAIVATCSSPNRVMNAPAEHFIVVRGADGGAARCPQARKIFSKICSKIDAGGPIVFAEPGLPG
jgi:hypothetical protein